MKLIHIESLSRKTTKAQLLGFLNSVRGMERYSVGRIDLRGSEAIIEVPDQWQVRLVQALDGKTLGARRVRVWAERQERDSAIEDCYFDKLAHLLELEGRAEATRVAERDRRLSPTEAEKTGLSLVDLVITDEDSGLGGRYILQLAKRKGGSLPWTRLGVGSPVVLSRDTDKGRVQHRGVVVDLRAHTLDLLVQEHADVKLARKLVKEAMSLFRKAGRFTRSKPAPGERQARRQEARSLLEDARHLEDQAVEHVLDTADVLCATTTALTHEVLGRRRFDLAVIDEACQSTEPGCWLPLLWCDKVVLAGDHQQLPPTVVSQEAAAQGLGVSLFERLMEAYQGTIARALTVQYRMHRDIMDFPSQEFYASDLKAHPSVREHLLTDLQGVTENDVTKMPMEFIDTAGASFDEEVEPDGESRLNQQEATLVCSKVQNLLEWGVAPSDIAVIATYAAQVRLLRERLSLPGLEIDSVDGFQGREKEVIVISLVRSNPQGEIGFLKELRRMNVAMTRARRKLLVIGDSATISGDPFYSRMIETFEMLDGYRTVWEEEDGVTV